MERVWYVAYGSNVASGRFRCYLGGGRPVGGTRVYDGCRDPRAPSAERSLELAGRLVFAGRSKVWGGGKAFYDVSAPGTVAAKAYLVSVEQFADIAAQEMWSPPGGDFASRVADLLPQLDTMTALGAGDYETVHRLGQADGHPLLTVTSDRLAELEPAAPAAPYLWWIATGLKQAHGWNSSRVGHYLSEATGARGSWSAADVTALVDRPAPPTSR